MKMMKTTLFAIAAMAAVSCVKEQIADNSAIVNPNLVECTFYAGTETSETKAAFSEDAYPQIEWQGNEEISVLGTNTANQKFSTSSTGTTAEFNGVADLTDEVLYAVYPYDAAVELTADGKLSKVTVPAVQTATAGSFDPKAYIAVAKSTDKEHFAFKAVGGFVKFQLEDAANVKSVVIAANDALNDGGNIACSATVTINGNNISHGSPYGTNSTTSIKMTGIFEANTDYFFIVRSGQYKSGITLYIEYTDGTVLKRAGTNPLFEGGKTRNYIRNLGTLKKSDFTQVNDLYSLYNMGYDIIVGNKTINKETYNSATLVSENFELAAANASKVYFVEQNADFTFNTDAGIHDLIIIGNDPYNKADFILKQNIRLNMGTNDVDGIFIAANLKFDGSKASYGMNINANGQFGYIGLKNCDIIMGGKSLYYLQNNDRAIGEFYMEGCNYNITAGTQRVLQLGTSTSTYGKITFKNNIFYCKEDAGVGRFYLLQGDKSTLDEVHLIQNTFAGVYNCDSGNNRGYVDVSVLNKVYITNNLFYLPLFDTAAYANAKYTSIIKCATLPTEGNAQKNVILKPAESSENIAIRPLKYSGSDFNTTIAPSNTASTENNYSKVINTNTLNLENGIIESVNSQYGATR